MKKYIAVLTLITCSTTFTMHDAPRQLPSAGEIHQRLHNVELGHFADKSGLHKSLGNERLNPLAVERLVEFSVQTYNAKFPECTLFATQALTIRDLILKDTPILKDAPTPAKKLILMEIPIVQQPAQQQQVAKL